MPNYFTQKIFLLVIIIIIYYSYHTIVIIINYLGNNFWLKIIGQNNSYPIQEFNKHHEKRKKELIIKRIEKEHTKEVRERIMKRLSKELKITF